MKYKRNLILILIVFFSNYFLDRITKLLALHFLKNNENISLLGHTINIFLIKNNGAFLSAGSGLAYTYKLIIMIIIPLIFCLGAILYCLIKENDRNLIIIIVSIAAGGIGNLQDRIFNGQVTDFLNFRLGNLQTGVLNVADMSITFGVIAFLIYELYKTRKEKSNTVEEKELVE